MATDFGRDLSCKDDLDPAMREVDGLELMGEAAHRRLRTRRGQLIDDLDYGIDVIDFLSDEVTPSELAQIPGQVDAELRKDLRVEESTTSSTWDTLTQKLTLSVVGQTALGPFDLTLPVTADTVSAIFGA